MPEGTRASPVDRQCVKLPAAGAQWKWETLMSASVYRLCPVLKCWGCLRSVLLGPHPPSPPILGLYGSRNASKPLLINDLISKHRYRSVDKTHRFWFIFVHFRPLPVDFRRERGPNQRNSGSLFEPLALMEGRGREKCGPVRCGDYGSLAASSSGFQWSLPAKKALGRY